MKEIKVPRGIRYITDWNDFSLPEFPIILDKKIPGCGFTEWCLTSPKDIILCSPRKILIQNKYEQHIGDVYLVQNDEEQDINTDKELDGNPRIASRENSSIYNSFIEKQGKGDKVFDRISQEIQNYYHSRKSSGRPVKILVTYDSYRLVYEILQDMGVFDNFHTVIDEFQSIFTDAKFKSSVERWSFKEYYSQFLRGHMSQLHQCYRTT